MQEGLKWEFNETLNPYGTALGQLWCLCWAVRLAWGTDCERTKSSFSFPAGPQGLLAPAGPKIPGEQLWLHPTAAWPHLIPSLQAQTPQNTFQLCYRCLAEQGGGFPAWAQVCVPAVLGSSGHGWAVLIPPLPVPSPRAAAVAGQECCCLQSAAIKGQANTHQPHPKTQKTFPLA